jgi:hypothetical protein
VFSPIPIIDQLFKFIVNSFALWISHFILFSNFFHCLV